MLKASYDQEHNTVIIEFEGHVDTAQAEQFYSEIQEIVPKHGKGFKLLSDFTLLDKMDIEVRETVKKTMDFFNEQGVTEIIRVVPNPEKDFGFSIMSLFHYSKEVKFLTLPSREEAEKRLNENQQNRGKGISSHM